ncbi:MAG: MaoC/PaaZ C-terminal domain-containing protein [Actinomycetota bacterium]
MLNFALRGKTYPAVTITVTADEIAAYAAASGDTNPQHAPGSDQIASIVFPVVHGLPLMGVVTTDPELNVENPLMIVHGEQEIVHHRPTRPGDTLVLTPSLVSVEDKGKGATFVARVAAATPKGELVNEQWATIFVRGAGSGSQRAPNPLPAQPERSEAVATFTRHVATTMPAAYAAASGDHNPIHLDPVVAQMVGLPGVINHGLGTLSLVSGGLVEHLASGDASRVTRLAVRFTDMVIPGSDVITTAWRSGTGFGFETTRPDGKVVLTGTLNLAVA